jgi:hypothetical protein
MTDSAPDYSRLDIVCFAPEQLSRFETDIFAERPSLAIWQVGTNAVIHNEKYDLDHVAAAITAGSEYCRANLHRAPCERPDH